ncbi:cytochrome P450 [Multifurca ochricompacta]|uniref:Cytochrome P450 n=1 Tax=Multifurca ochricompacta TaxID=376703 RepID=A0AAD4LX51_9AGAM|nr:cytochrome P450 [Multifurca ochricompacta]
MVSALMTFSLACLLHPETQKKAQDETDFVTGRERLPTFEDRPRLPFVDGICNEVSRWMPVGTSRSEDNVYEGYLVPKGVSWYTVVVTTFLRRAILDDPAVYPEPDTFKPERFLNSD